jgi:hypothetical protein
MSRLGLSLALALLAGTVALTTPAANAAAARHWFSSPTHNIGCYVDKTVARCDVARHTYPSPPKPAGCPADWGDAVQVTRRARLTCHGDTTLGATYVLAYGHRVRFGDKACISRRSGMVCKNLRTRHGFRLSAGSYRLW